MHKIAGATRTGVEDADGTYEPLETLETQKCLDEGVLTSTADANVGSILASASRRGPVVRRSTSSAVRDRRAPARKPSWPGPRSWPLSTATAFFLPPESLMSDCPESMLWRTRITTPATGCDPGRA